MEAVQNGCPICFEGVSEKETSSVQPCGHTFCLECIIKWAVRNPTCPLCLAKIDAIPDKEKLLEDKFSDLKVSVSENKLFQEEEFGCFDHQYFIKEFRTLYKKVEDVEFDLKAQIGMRKKKSGIEKSYQMALHMKQEIDMKINFLGRIQKITPKDLLEDIQYFTGLLKNIKEDKVPFESFGEHERCQYDYDEDYYYDQGEEYYDEGGYSIYNSAVTTNFKSKKKSKNKAKNKKDLLQSENTTVIFS